MTGWIVTIFLVVGSWQSHTRQLSNYKTRTSAEKGGTPHDIGWTLDNSMSIFKFSQEISIQFN